MAAVLHDTIEDTDTRYEELVEHFGRKVADVVAEVTDDKLLPTPRRKALQIERAPHLSRRAALVKLADKTCNQRDVAHHPPAGWPLARQRQYFDWARAVVEALPPVSKKLRRAFDAAQRQRCAASTCDPVVSQSRSLPTRNWHPKGAGHARRSHVLVDRRWWWCSGAAPRVASRGTLRKGGR